MTDFSKLKKAEQFYDQVRTAVIPLAKQINEALHERHYPHESSFNYENGNFLIEYGSTWGRRCSCCSPDHKMIRIPLKLVGASQIEIEKHIDILKQEDEEEY